MTSYRNAAEMMTAHCAVSVSAMGVWNIVQALENKESQRVERYAELAEQSAGTETLAAPILYEENDGVWLKLQGKHRKKYGADTESRKARRLTKVPKICRRNPERNNAVRKQRSHRPSKRSMALFISACTRQRIAFSIQTPLR